MKGTIRFLGIDPGLRNTGWGVIEACDNIISHVADGRIVSDGKAPMADRLLQIFESPHSVNFCVSKQELVF